WALSIAWRISLTPDKTADNWINWASTAPAIICAKVVLPVPGGPQNTMECTDIFATILCKGLPADTKCVCPTTCDRVWGLSLSAKGRCFTTGIGSVIEWLVPHQHLQAARMKKGHRLILDFVQYH